MAEWNTPKTDWVAGDIPMVDDFNRIEGNIDFLKQDIETKKGIIVNAINDMNQPAQVTDTHAQLASKIRDISKDATAAVGDVEKGKTFYAGGQKRTGTLELTGNATAADVLSGRTFYNTNLKSKVTGTMPNRGAVSNTITTQGGQYTIPSGYHNGSGKVTASFSNLSAGNIKNGVNIGGVVGNYKGEFVISPGDTVIFSSPSEKKIEYARNTPTKAKEIRVDTPGYYRVSFRLAEGNYGYSGRAQIYINGEPYGSYTQTQSSSVIVTQDININAGDLVQVYGWGISHDRYGVRISDYKISIQPPSGSVTLN